MHEWEGVWVDEWAVSVRGQEGVKLGGWLSGQHVGGVGGYMGNMGRPLCVLGGQ